MESYSRRRTLAVAGSAVLAGLAGCAGGSDDSSPYDGWLAGANNFETVVDQTGTETVTIDVGAPNPYAFDPAAVQISPGTTVVWEWSGRGREHNVVDINTTFESDLYLEEGKTFNYTFEDPGAYKYYCEPHRAQGMLGVVEVVDG